MSEEEEVPLIKSERAGSQKSSCDSALQVHLYYSPSLNSEATFTIPTGPITAESVCMLAAKASGETLTHSHTQHHLNINYVKGQMLQFFIKYSSIYFYTYKIYTVYNPFLIRCNKHCIGVADNFYKVRVYLLDDSVCLKHRNYS